MKNSFFVVLFLALIGLIGYITQEYHVSQDITQSTRNTLSEGSVDVLKQMDGPVNIRVFVSQDDQYRKTIHDFMSRYQRAKKDIKSEFINPAEFPTMAQAEGIQDRSEEHTT